MTTTQHTPGPWSIAGYHVGTMGVTVASVIYAAGAERANARLIAAAPDLLAALERIANSEEYHGDTFSCDFETLQSVARAAIAKATGQDVP